MGIWRRIATVSVITRISSLIEPVISDLGYVLVRLQITGQHTKCVEIMIERSDFAPLTLGDCTQVSRTLSQVLDDADIISSAYHLEVSSPGIDRPLVTLDDFQRFSGNQARIDLVEPINGRHKYTGVVQGTDGDIVRVSTGEEDARIPFTAIRRAKLVMTDALLRASSVATKRDEPAATEG